MNGLQKAESIFKKIRTGNLLTIEEQRILQGAVLLELGKMYHEKIGYNNFHIGAI
ncbi:MAG: hypothetical protein U5K54_05495 [Cytophagales bacterium]|nr:hypothetical protein [Cytophagales bacterium]